MLQVVTYDCEIVISSMFYVLFLLNKTLAVFFYSHSPYTSDIYHQVWINCNHIVWCVLFLSHFLEVRLGEISFIISTISQATHRKHSCYEHNKNDDEKTTIFSQNIFVCLFVWYFFSSSTVLAVTIWGVCALSCANFISVLYEKYCNFLLPEHSKKNHLKTKKKLDKIRVRANKNTKHY